MINNVLSFFNEDKSPSLIKNRLLNSWLRGFAEDARIELSLLQQ